MLKLKQRGGKYEKNSLHYAFDCDGFGFIVDGKFCSCT